MARLSLTLLGGFEARLASGPTLAMPTKKAQGLLAFLALPPGQPRSREKLAALLWGDTGEAQARDSLRHTLVALRKVLPATPPALVVSGGVISLNPAMVDVDVVTFERRVAEGTASALEAGAALYRGDLLDGFGLKEAPFEEWLAAERERLRALALQALTELLARQIASGATERATRTATRLLALDACHEPVHRALMRLYAQQGRRGAALRQYQTCATVLQRELGAQPEPETRQLYQDILQRRSSGAPAPTGALEIAPGRRAQRRPDPAGVPITTWETGFVGRESELGRLHQALAEASSGRGRIVTVVGEAGVGKSRLVAELIESARGARVLVGRAYENARILPFGPWVDAFRTGGLVTELDKRETLPPSWRTELARLFPELGGAAAPGERSAEGYVRLFETLAQVLGSLSAQQPVVFVLEDLQWADDISLQLLAFVSRRVSEWRTLLVATVREENLGEAPMLRRVLAELDEARRAASIVVRPLDHGATVALIEDLARTGTEASDIARLGEQVWTVSEGNPLVVIETIRALQAGDILASPAGVPLPERIRTTVGRRLEQLSERARQVAAVAGVIGRESDFALLQRAAGLDPSDTAEAVEELVRRRVLHVVGERLDFTHDRIREVTYGAILAPHRKLRHQQVAEALETLYAGNLEPHYAVIGAHYRASEQSSNAAAYFIKAAERAAEAFAYREAVALNEQALALTDPDNMKQRADLLQRIAWHPFFYADYGYHEQSFRYATEALALYERLDDKPNIIATQMHLLTLYAEGQSRAAGPSRVREHVDALAALVEHDPDSMQKGLVYQRIAHTFLHRGEPATSAAWARKAVDVFTRLRVPMGTSLGTALTYTGEVDAGIAYNEQNLGPVLESGNVLIMAMLGHELALGLALVRDVPRAKACAEHVTPAVGKRQNAMFEAMVRRPSLMICTLAGDAAGAAEAADRLTALERQSFRGCVFEDGACVGLHHLRGGRLEDARADLERRLSLYRDTYQAGAVSACALVLASVELEMGNPTGAEELALNSLQKARDGGNVLLELWALPVLAETYVAVGQTAKAAQAIARAFELLQRGKSWYGLPAPVHLVNGMLATSLGQWNDADVSFETALAVSRQFGLRYDEGRTHCEWGRMRRARNRRGDRQAADENFASALEIFRRIGAERDVAKILSVGRTGY